MVLAEQAEEIESTDRRFGPPAGHSSFIFRALHDLGHEASHGFRRLILHLAGSVGVGTQGEPCIVVTQHTGDSLDVHTVLQSQGCESMPKLMQAEDGE